MSPSPARLRGPIVVVVFLVLACAAAAGGWLAIASRPQPTRIVALAAIDAEYAVLVREVANAPARSFLSLFHIERGELWGALVPRHVTPSGAHTALVATSGVVAVHAESERGIDLIAFDAARGEKLGRLAVTQPAAGGSPTSYQGSVFAGGISFELVHGADGGAVTAIDMMRGQPIWHTALGPGSPGLAWLRGPHLLVYSGGRLHILERATGRAAGGTEGGVAMDPIPCVLADRVYGRRDGVLHAIALPGGRARALPAVMPGQIAGMCGQHGDRDLLATVLAGGHGALVAVDRDTGEHTWTIELEAPLDTRHLPRPTGFDTAALSGSLPRFVPLLLEDGDTGVLVMLDLDAGRVAWRSRSRPELRDARLARVPGKQQVWLGLGTHLAVLDGNTGSLHAAVALNGYAPLWPDHLAGDRLWLHDGTRWAVLDADSLAVLPGAGKLSILPGARDDLARKLGLAADTRHDPP